MTDQWMSPNDTMLWRIERDPLLRSTITGVWFLPAAPDRSRCDASVARMIEGVPRLRERVIDDHPNVGAPRWERDPLFDLGYHYRWAKLAGRRPRRDDVMRHAAHMAKRAFDRDRPLWELEVITGLPKGSAALVFKVHHAIADGLGLVLVLQHVVDLAADGTAGFDAQKISDAFVAPAAIEGTPRPDPLAGLARALGQRISSEADTARRAGRSAVRAANDLLRDPVGSVSNLARTSTSVANLVKPATTPLSSLMSNRSLRVRFDTLTVSLAGLKAAARTIDGGTLNDAFVAAVLEGLDRYHRELDAPTDSIRMHMPISVRADGDHADEIDNQFAPARVELPLGADDLRARLTAVRMRLRAVRAEPALPHLNDVSGAIGRLGPDISVSVVGAMMKGVDVTTSNVPGPPFPVFFAGQPVEEFFAFGPLAGAAVNITLFSYDGTLHFAITSDESAVTEPGRLVRCLAEAFDAVVALGDRTP